MELGRISQHQASQKLARAAVRTGDLAVLIKGDHTYILSLEVFLARVKLDNVVTAMIIHEQSILDILCREIDERERVELSCCHLRRRI